MLHILGNTFSECITITVVEEITVVVEVRIISLWCFLSVVCRRRGKLFSQKPTSLQLHFLHVCDTADCFNTDVAQGHFIVKLETSAGALILHFLDWLAIT